MEIVFLGTCHGCAEKGRFYTSTLLRTEECSYLIDAGAPFQTLMKNKDIPVSELRAAFITHMHGDHASYAPDFAAMCNFEKIHGVIYLPEEQSVSDMKNWIYALHGEDNYNMGYCKIESAHTGNFFDDGNIRVKAIPTHHLKRGVSLAYLIEHRDKKVLFTGDLSDSFIDFPQTGKTDAVVCELTHFDVKNAISVLNSVKTDIIIFNHVRDDKVKLLKENDDKISFDYKIANDGDVFQI